MNTPIVDYVKQYAEKNSVRFHMPGHKGEEMLGFEAVDITEIKGADVLYSPTGIIKESEDNASSLFSTLHTFYSAEGSSLTVKAMLYLIKSFYGNNLRLLAGRNAHKTFVYGCGLLDIDPIWMYGENSDSLCECKLTPHKVESYLRENKGNVVYITSPDYLGNIADIKGISEVCKKYGALLVVDNSHGAYLKFLSEDIHPITLGADICCDSAHKTLPVLTGGGYLHISKNADKYFLDNARGAMSLFASTSPSYLILQSLDMCNKYLADDYKKELKHCIDKTQRTKSKLKDLGFEIYEGEKIKIVINANSVGYTGEELGDIFSEKGIDYEFADDTYLVYMVSPKNKDEDFEKLISEASKIHKKEPIIKSRENISEGERVLTIREALFKRKEIIPVDEAQGRICASPTVSCPPAIPVAVSGEKITKENIEILKKYNIKTIEVIEKTSF